MNEKVFNMYYLPVYQKTEQQRIQTEKLFKNTDFFSNEKTKDNM